MHHACGCFLWGRCVGVVSVRASATVLVLFFGRHVAVLSSVLCWCNASSCNASYCCRLTCGCRTMQLPEHNCQATRCHHPEARTFTRPFRRKSSAYACDTVGRIMMSNALHKYLAEVRIHMRNLGDTAWAGRSIARAALTAST